VARISWISVSKIENGNFVKEKQNKKHCIHCNWYFNAIVVSIVSEIVLKCEENLQRHKNTDLSIFARK